MAVIILARLEKLPGKVIEWQKAQNVDGLCSFISNANLSLQVPWREGERTVLIFLGFNCRDDIPLADSWVSSANWDYQEQHFRRQSNQFTISPSSAYSPTLGEGQPKSTIATPDPTCCKKTFQCRKVSTRVLLQVKSHFNDSDDTLCM